MSDKLASIRLAHAAAETAMRRALRLLIASCPDSAGTLVVDGEAVTSERVRLEITSGSEPGIVWDAITVTHGTQSADPDSLGDGAIRAGAPIVIDLYPAAPPGFYADLARTVVVGAAPTSLVECHRLCVEVLDSLEQLLGPGVPARELWLRAHESFVAVGAREGPVGSAVGDVWHLPFLGHGVGRVPHESPTICDGPDLLAPGDVIALEPALYRRDLGGCRIENLYQITSTGHERLTNLPVALDPAEVLATVADRRPSA